MQIRENNLTYTTIKTCPPTHYIPYFPIRLRFSLNPFISIFQAECHSAKTEPSKTPHHLNALLDHLLQPEKPIEDQETIDWCRWLVGGGRSYEDFAANGKIINSVVVESKSSCRSSSSSEYEVWPLEKV